MDITPKCYGAYGRRQDVSCRNCEYRESCEFYTNNKGDPPLLVDRFIPLDALGGNRDYTRKPGGPFKGTLSREEVSDFVKCLMNLDEYTLGMISEVASGKAHSIRDLADKSGVPRQVMARKVADILAANPELILLFMPLMPKLSAGRQRFLRHLPESRRAKRVK